MASNHERGRGNGGNGSAPRTRPATGTKITISVDGQVIGTCTALMGSSLPRVSAAEVTRRLATLPLPPDFSEEARALVGCLSMPQEITCERGDLNSQAPSLDDLMDATRWYVADMRCGKTTCLPCVVEYARPGDLKKDP